MFATLLLAVFVVLVRGNDPELTVKDVQDVEFVKDVGTGWDHDARYYQGFSVGVCYTYVYNLVMRLKYKEEPNQVDEKKLRFVSEFYDNVGNSEVKSHMVSLSTSDREQRVFMRLEVPYACICQTFEDKVQIHVKVTMEMDGNEYIVIEDEYENNIVPSPVVFGCSSTYPADETYFFGRSKLTEHVGDQTISARIFSNITVSNKIAAPICVNVSERVSVDNSDKDMRMCTHKFFVPEHCVHWKVFTCDLQETEYRELKKVPVTGIWNAHAISEGVGWEDKFMNERVAYVGGQYSPGK